MSTRRLTTCSVDCSVWKAGADFSIPADLEIPAGAGFSVSPVGVRIRDNTLAQCNLGVM